MKCEEKAIKQFILTLSEEEAGWLKGVMQNPLWGEVPEEEDAYTKKMRQTLFETLWW